MRVVYQAEFIEDSPGYYVAFEQFPSIHTEGYNIMEASQIAADALKQWLEHCFTVQDDFELPEPTIKTQGENLLMLVSVDIEVDDDKLTMSYAEAAEYLGLSEAQIRAMFRDGILEGFKKEEIRGYSNRQ